MRIIFNLYAPIILAFLYGNQLYAAPNLLLQCLAKEEGQFHLAKSHNALYRINQEFLNELASTNDIILKKKYVDEICNSKTLPPTIGLLRLLLLKESDIYDLSFTEIDPSMRPFKLGYINEFQKQIPRFFIQYISGIQAELPTPNCLTKAIPEIKSFNQRLKYLEEEMDIHEIIKDKNKIDRIFTKLQNLKSIKAECYREKKMLLKRKMKKKQSTNL